MTHKRGRGKTTAKDELESPEKKVKFMDHVSNQDLSEEENQEVENEGSTERLINTRQRTLKEKLKIQLGSGNNSSKNVQVQVQKALTDESVESTKDDANGVPTNLNLLNIECLNTVIGIEPQIADSPWNEIEVVTETEAVDDNDHSLNELMKDLEDGPSEAPIEQTFVISVQDRNVLVYKEPIVNKGDVNSADSVENVIKDNVENENTENILIDRTNVEKNQDEPTVDSPLSEKITNEILLEGAKKLRAKKAKSKKIKTKVSSKSKVKTKHHKTKSNTNERLALPVVQHITNEENETFCNVCERTLDGDLKCHNGEPLGGFEEGAAILDSRLLLFDGDEANVSIEDVRSYNKITDFSVYCKNGHFCSFDCGLIEKDVEVYFSGYVKPIHSDDASIEGGVPGIRFGPIASWWITGFDVGENPTIALSTELGDYICMEPSAEYAPFMSSTMKKMYISKIVIELLNYQPDATYEDLLTKLQTTPVPNDLLKNFNEDTLLHYAPFICNQVISFDDTAKPKEKLMVTAPCIRRLIYLAGIKFEVDTSEPPRKAKHIYRERQFEHKINYREKRLRQVAANNKENPYASELIDILLPINEESLNSHKIKPWRCGVCERCLRNQCRDCKACSARNYEACYLRRCFNYEIMEEHEEDLQDEIEFSNVKAEDSFTRYRNAVRPLSVHTYDIAWGTKPLWRDEKRIYYGSVSVNRLIISPGDFVDARSLNAGVPPQIMKVAYLYQNEAGVARIHACFLWSGKYTVLGDITDRKELFFVNKCIDIDVKSIVTKVKVLERVSNNLDNSMVEDQEHHYICQRTYDPLSGTFHDLLPEDKQAREKYGAPYRYCWVCDRNNAERAKESPMVFNKLDDVNGRVTFEYVRFSNEEYRVGSAVYLKPKSLYFKYPMLSSQPQFRSLSDEEKYSELYRKAKDEEVNRNENTPTPFNVGYITGIFMDNEKLFLKVLKLYRPENTSKGEKLSKSTDANLLFWSNEITTVSFNYVVGKCYLTHKSSTDNIQEWSRQGPDRFYFSEMYKDDELVNIRKGEHGCPSELCNAPLYLEAKLKALNIFAGCGGLALGLQQAEAVECKWAIEPSTAAAATFQLNNPDTAVFVSSHAEIINKIMKKDFKVNNHRLPKKGDVELLCATLPPESWRKINNVNAFKNSNIATFLVYLEYYKPPYFVLDADDVLLKRSTVLKLALACFIRLGYQVSFDLLQVGNFGAPQNCCRTIIMGAWQGRILPDCPKSQYTFSKSACHNSVVIDKTMYHRRNWTESAPYKATTILDAMLDLAALELSLDEVTKYSTQSVSHYQRMMRYDLTEPDRDRVFNHASKDLGPLVHARMSHIPIAAGSDWRNLPNIELQLRDKSRTNKLIYSYDDPELGKRKKNEPRGVCRCSLGKQCDPSDVQENTLIPWHLVHSGKRHGHWAGLYGKLQWSGVFVGTSTNPEPLAKQAPIIHPSKNRVPSVRESARAQGFPDNYIFSGGYPIHEMYRQIGLSTSPLLARAIGFEIAKSATMNAAQ